MCFAFSLTTQHCIVWREKQYGTALRCLGRKEFAGTVLVSSWAAEHCPSHTENPADVTVRHQRLHPGSSRKTWAAWAA